MAYNNGLIDLQLLGFFKEEADKAYTNKLEGVKVNGEELEVDGEKRVNVDLKSYATVKDLEALREQVGSFGHVQGAKTTQELRDLKNGLTEKGTVWANSDEHGVLYMYVGVGSPGADAYGLIYLGNAIDPGDFATKAALQSHMDYAEARLAEKANRSWTDTYFVRKTQADDLYIKKEDLDGVLSEDALKPYLKEEEAEGKFASKEDLTKVHGLIKGDCLKRELESKKADALVGDVWIVLDESNTAYYFDGKNFAPIGADVDLREYAKLTDLRNYAPSSELNHYLTKSAAEGLYASKEDFETHKSNAWNTYATKDELTKKFGESVNRAELDAYLTNEKAGETYLTKEDAENQYVTPSDMTEALIDSYVSKDFADGPEGYATKAELKEHGDYAEETYLKKTEAEDEYAGKSDLEDVKAQVGAFSAGLKETTTAEMPGKKDDGETWPGDVFKNTDDGHYYVFVGTDVPGADGNGFVDMGDSVGPGDFATRAELEVRGLGSVNNFATKPEVKEGLDKKADKTELAEGLEKKADKTDLDGLATQTELAEGLDKKADKTDLEKYAKSGELDGKADKETVENLASLLEGKADQSELEDLKAQIGAFNQAVLETDTAGLGSLSGTAEPGDVFFNTDDSHYYVFVGTDVPGADPNGFVDLGGSVGPGDFATRAELQANGLGSANNFATKPELKEGLSGKADKSELEALSRKLEELKSSTGGLTGGSKETDSLEQAKGDAKEGDVFFNTGDSHYYYYLGEGAPGAGENGFVDLGETVEPGDFATRAELDTKADKGELDKLKQSVDAFNGEEKQTSDLSQAKENAKPGDVFLDTTDDHYKEFVGEGSPGADGNGFVDLGESVDRGDFATRPELEALKDQVESQSGNFDSFKTDLDNRLGDKADQSALDTAVEQAQQALEQKADKDKLEQLETKLQDEYTDTNTLNGLLDGKADDSELAELGQKLQDEYTNTETLNGLLDGKVDDSEFNDLSQKLQNDYTDTAALNDLLEGKADKTQILDWLLKDEAAITYLSIIDASKTYLTKDNAKSLYLDRQAYADLNGQIQDLQEALFKSGKMRDAVTKEEMKDPEALGANSGDYFVCTDDGNHLYLFAGKGRPAADANGFIDLGTHVDLSNYVQSSTLSNYVQTTSLDATLTEYVKREDLDDLQNLLNFSVASEEDIDALFTA